MHPIEVRTVADQPDRHPNNQRRLRAAWLPACLLATQLGFALPLGAQSTTLSVVCSMERDPVTGVLVRAPQPESMLHVGVSTPRPANPQGVCVLFVSLGTGGPLVLRGVPIVVNLANSLRLTNVRVQPNPGGAGKWAFDCVLPPSLPIGVTLAMQAVVPSAGPWPRDISNGITAITGSAGSPEYHYGCATDTAGMHLVPIDVDAMAHLPEIVFTYRSGLVAPNESGGLSAAPVVAADGDSAVTVVSGQFLGLPGRSKGGVCILRNLLSGAPHATWVPLNPSSSTGFEPVGVPQFVANSNTEFWVLEADVFGIQFIGGTFYKNGYRMSRYDTNANLVASFVLQTRNTVLSQYNVWTQNADGSGFVFKHHLDGGQGVSAKGFTIGGLPTFTTVLSATGFSGAQQFVGLPSDRAVVQYLNGSGGVAGLRIINRTTGVVGTEIVRLNHQAIAAADAAFGLVGATSVPSTLDVFDTTTYTPASFGLVDGGIGNATAMLRGSAGQVVVTDGSAPFQVKRIELKGGVASVEAIDRNPILGGPAFAVYGGSDPLYLSLPGRNAVMVPLGSSQQESIVLDITTMTYMSLNLQPLNQPTTLNFRVGRYMF